MPWAMFFSLEENDIVPSAVGRRAGLAGGRRMRISEALNPLAGC